MTSQEQTCLVIVDDHRLFRKGLIELIEEFPEYQVIWEAENGRDFTQQIAVKQLPEIVLLDISMPIMDGYETAQWISQYYDQVKILALSMNNDEETILKMLQTGVDGYLMKNADPSELKLALEALKNNGTYYTNWVTDALLKKLYSKKSVSIELSTREIEFLKLACTELPYKAFGPLLGIHPRVVEATREILFRKLNVTTRVGLVVYAIKHKIFIIA